MELLQRGAAPPAPALAGRVLDEDDLDDELRDRLVDEVSAAVELDQLRSEIAALQELLAQAKRVRDHARDSKLAALRACLEKAEFKELSDGRGKLLIFTEHRDTLTYLCEHLQNWGFSIVVIHGGMNPHERKRAQDQFRSACQICVATEAAGEGINLQFCHLMINYDLPWNPMEIEQRIGRIHRIGQDQPVQVYNFCAGGSIEDRILDILDRKINMFELVIGEIDMILGRLTTEKEFSDLVFELWLEHTDEAQQAKAFDALGTQLKRARTAYEKSKDLDEKLFQDDFGT